MPIPSEQLIIRWQIVIRITRAADDKKEQQQSGGYQQQNADDDDNQQRYGNVILSRSFGFRKPRIA